MRSLNDRRRDGYWERQKLTHLNDLRSFLEVGFEPFEKFATNAIIMKLVEEFVVARFVECF